jgi:sortase A
VKALTSAIRGLGELLITAGVVVLLFLAWQLWWTDLTAGRQQDHTTAQLERSWNQPAPASPPTSAPTTPDLGPAAGEKVPTTPGTPFAVIHVPRFGKDYARPVLQGVDLDVLDQGVGHYPQSPGPGAVGNFAVAGHRVTYAKPFNQIAELRKGDPVVIETKHYWYVYRVVSHLVVTPDRVDVIAPVPTHPGEPATERMMTMTACHPEFSARERYVVFSRLEQRLPRVRGVVPDVLKGKA